MEQILDILKIAGLAALGSFVTFIAASFIKGGKIENWGIAAGKAVSKFGSMKIGKQLWEKIEDVITVSLVSFAQGFMKGANIDDTIINEENKNDKSK